MKDYQSGVQHQNPALWAAGKISKKINRFGLLTALITVSIFASCKKDSTTDPKSGLKMDNTQALSPRLGKSLNLTKANGTISLTKSGDVYTVANYNINRGKKIGDNLTNGTYYFSLSDNDNKTGETADTPPKAARWDISFSGDGSSYIKLNRNTSLRYIDKPFANVTLYDWEKAVIPTNTSDAGFGHNRIFRKNEQADNYPGSGTMGWCNYTLANHTVLPIYNRTILIKDYKDNVYAMEFTTVYIDDNPIIPPNHKGPMNFGIGFKYKDLGDFNLQ